MELQLVTKILRLPTPLPSSMLVANLLAHFCSALPSIVLYHIESTSKANFGSFFGGFFYENVESLNNFCY